MSIQPLALSLLDAARPSVEAHAPFRRRLPPEIIIGAFVISDFWLVASAGVAAFIGYFSDFHSPEPSRYIILTAVAATVFVIGFERSGGYRLKQLTRLWWQLTHVLIVWGVTVSILLLTAFLEKVSDNYSRGWALGTIFTATGFLLGGRWAFHTALDHLARAGRLARRIAIVGAGEEGHRLIAALQHSKDPSFTVCGVFDDRKSRVPSSIGGLRLLGTTDDLLYFARRNVVDEVIVALPLDAEIRLRQLFHKLKGVACDLRLSAQPLAQKIPIQGLSYVGDAPVLEIADRPLKHWRATIKWAEDKILAAALLIVLVPLFGVIALAIRLDSCGPILFVQKRFGFNNDVINVLKFRTMHTARCDELGAARTVRSDPRVTRVGRVLRLLSLDELPQLVNVLRGDMSLVGPRPHAIAMRAGNLLYYEAVEQYIHRHRVKPGITGWAQVNRLRGEVDTLEKARARVEYDLQYIEHWSIWLDFKILLMTLLILASRENAY